MTDKERLEEIKAQYHILTRNGYDLGAWDEPFSWLIEQAERVQELEKELEANYDDRQLDIDYLKRENSNYRAALGNIANIDGYFIDKPFDMVRALELIDREARKALEESK